MLRHSRHADNRVDAGPFHKSGYDLDALCCAQAIHGKIILMLACKHVKIILLACRKCLLYTWRSFVGGLMAEQLVIQSLGGTARAKKLSKEDRSSIAKAAAQARWDKGKPLPQATHEGFLQIGAEIPCAVLEGGTRV